MARKKIREYDSKRLLKEHLPRLAAIHLPIFSAQVTKSTDFTELLNKEPWLSSTGLVVKPDMLFGKRGKSGLVALNLDFAQVIDFIKQHIGVEVEIEGCKGPITAFIIEPFIPHDQEYYLSISSERLGCVINFSDCGGIEIDENWDKVKSVFLPTEKSMTVETIAPLVATLPLEVRRKIGNFIMGVFAVFQDKGKIHSRLTTSQNKSPLKEKPKLPNDVPRYSLYEGLTDTYNCLQLYTRLYDLDFSFIEMNPFALVNEEPYPLDMRGELDECAAFRNEDKWGNVEFPMPFGRVRSPEEIFIDALKEKSNATLKFVLLNRKGRIWKMIPGGGSSLIYVDAIGDLGYASELGNYTDYTGTSEEEMYQLAMTILNCATANPDGRKRAFLIGGNISNTANIATTYDGLIRALREKSTVIRGVTATKPIDEGGMQFHIKLGEKSELKAAKMHIYVRRGGQNYKIGLAKMVAVGEELGIPVEVYGQEAIMTSICNQAILCIKS